MANYRKIREETLRIEQDEEYLSYEIPSINYATEYLYKGLYAIVNAYEGLPLDTLTINNIVADVRKVFTHSGIAHFLKRDVLVSILFEVDGGVSISTDISEDQ